ncbi:MAG: LacI family transcriptional repressor [Chloroflexi bacterium]|jgi:LacI family transcriptional regulator|nr:LacI family transcriptional repressor [Chloroflexota bacterium]
MATIRDVAKLASVSIATVSHVVNGTRFVEPATSDRVRTAIHELGFEADGIARSLRVRKTSTMALIIPDLTNPFFPELATVIQQEAVRSQYDVVIHSTDVPHGNSEELLGHYLRTIRQKRYDAVIYAETLSATPAVQQLLATGVPVVVIGGTAHPEVDSVYIDDYAAARDVTAWFVAKGHRAIAHISGAAQMSSSEERRRGFLEGLAAAGLPARPDFDVAGTFLRDGGYQAMLQLLACSPRPTAVFAANDLTAIGAILACLDSGLRVPDDIGIVGFDDTMLASTYRPTLTTVYHGQREIGAEVVRLALARIRGEFPEERQKIIVPHRLVERQSA